MTPATKAAAVAVIYRNSKTYRCELNGVQYCFDLEDHKRGQLEWMQDVYADQVKRFAVDVTDGAVLFLDSTALKIEKIGAGTRHNGTNIAFEYTTTEADPQKVVDIDYIPRRVYLDYISDVPISVDIYLNAQSGSAWTLTFPAAKTEAWK